MASVSPRGRSPQSPYDFESTGDTDESWQYLDYNSTVSGGGPASSAGGPASSIGFLPSPASGSLSGYAIVGQVSAGGAANSPAALSPLYLDVDPSTPGAGGVAFPTDGAPEAYVATGATEYIPGMPEVGDGEFMTPQNFLFTDQQLNEMAMMNTFQTAVPLTGLEAPEIRQQLLQQQQQQLRLEMGVPLPFQPDDEAAPWNPANLKQDGQSSFIIEQFTTPSPQSSASSISPVLGVSRSSPHFIKREPDSGNGSTKSSTPVIRRVKDGKVEKKKTSDSSSNSSGGGGGGKFVIVTPNSINALAGKPNPFECFEAMRTTQRGRKGPLANEIKENALQVRRLGACFCCHARKVKCDKERPCRNCKKLCVQVPQVVCWQFQDFLTVLFPEFIRAHFKREKMARFMSENIGGFQIGGVETPCEVSLFSGSLFSSVLRVKAKFFTPKSADVLKHWHLNVGKNQVDLQAQNSAPIALEMEGGALASGTRDELRKKIKEYIQALVQEPHFADQVTDAFRHTDMPTKVIQIVQNYAIRCDSPIVKRALSIYAQHYVMTRHLCLTRGTITNLSSTKLVPQNVPWLTPRVLNRQIKSILDELLMRDMQHLFEAFSKSLKPKSRREWAPCLAAFLVLCLFMESVESAADHFVISQNEINLRNSFPPQYRRAFALNICQEVENLPFKQFAYQFHQIYMTHSRDAASKSFNPLVDDEFLSLEELDAPAMEMVIMLRDLLQGPNWAELDFLTMDPILPNEETHPYPRDVSLNYTGRLLAKFLLSFTDEKYIFDTKF